MGPWATVGIGLVAVVIGVTLYAAVIAFALRWSRKRWDPDGDSTPLDDR
jgi:hypothetical protein